MSERLPVVVYGASGYTGRLVMEHLRELGVGFVAAGRSRAKIEEALKLVPGIENAIYEIAEVAHDAQALANLFEGRKVVCNTVGPFMRFCRPVVEAALKSGLHYMDTTGEQHVVAMLMREYGADYAAAGLALMPSTSCMYGLSEMAAQFCLETPGIDTIDITEVAVAVPTVGSAQTILDAVRHPAYYLENNELVRYPGIETGQIVTPSGRVLTASNWGGTSNPIWFSRDGRVRNCRMSVAMTNQELWKKELGLERAYKVSLQWVPDEQLYPLLDQMSKDITPHTPPRESRFVHRAVDTVVGTGNKVMVKVTLMSTGGYYTTGLLQAYAAMRLSRETPRAVGFRSPSEVLGHREMLGALESFGYAAIGIQQIV